MELFANLIFLIVFGNSLRNKTFSIEIFSVATLETCLQDILRTETLNTESNPFWYFKEHQRKEEESYGYFSISSLRKNDYTFPTNNCFHPPAYLFLHNFNCVILFQITRVERQLI